MPSFGQKSQPQPPPGDPDRWRPQQFGRGGRIPKDAIIEPSWNGIRVLARFQGGRLRFIDTEGVDCTAEFQAVADAVTAAALASALVLDGYLTSEPTQDLTGITAPEVSGPNAGQLMAQLFVGERLARPAQSAERSQNLDPSGPIAFVAVDLLTIDDSILFDVPLLERKRLLDGALKESELVRVTPFVRPPIGSLLNTWRGSGFDALAYKGANSRYTPGARNDDWSIVRMPPMR
jgi:bifunctional non-homologous end joining protein LigD